MTRLAPVLANEASEVFMLATHVRWVNLDGLIYVLDLKAETYFALEPTYSKAWIALATGGREEGRHLDKDFYNTLRENGWLASVARPSRPARWRAIGWVPRTLRCSSLAAWVCLAYVSVSLKWRGFHDFVQRLESLPPASDDGSQEVRVKLAEIRFLRAERFFISSRGADDCLPRSLALYLFIVLCCGLSARHHIGISRYPFKAHAWVTHHRIALLDKQSRIDELSDLAVFGDSAS